jgi:glutaconate CoA-transferase subunit A
MTPDILYDQMIGMGCARRLVFSWGGNPGVGSLHRLRDAVEHAWPAPLQLEEYTHAAMSAMYQAGASRLPFAVLRGFIGNDLPQFNDRIRKVICPFSGEVLAAVPALEPDVTILHAQRADRLGNVWIRGIIGAQKEAALSARRVIVTVEEVVDELQAPMNSVVLPHWVLAAVCEVPQGAYPSYAHGFYQRDNSFYIGWDAISRERERFLSWMQRHVLDAPDFGATMRLLGQPPLQETA